MSELYNTNLNEELDWDSEISKDSEFVLLPDGEYEFVVTGFERGRHNGSEKLPPCNKAVVTVEINTPDGKAVLTNNFFLHRKCEGMLCAFFTSIGQRKHGEPLRMNWHSVVGCKGRCKVGTRTWKKDSGEEMKSNEIKKFLEPIEPKQPTASGFQPGKF